MHTCIHTYIHTYTHTHIHTHTHTFIPVSDIVGIALQFATQNCLGCYSKLNLDSKFHAEVTTYFPHIKLRTLYLEYNIIIIATQLLQIATQFKI